MFAATNRDGFSALQRAENSSKRPRIKHLSRVLLVSVLFSEPKIPQIDDAVALDRRGQ